MGPGDDGEGGRAAQPLPRQGVRQGEGDGRHAGGPHHQRVVVGPVGGRGGNKPEPGTSATGGLHGRGRPHQVDNGRQ